MNYSVVYSILRGIFIVYSVIVYKCNLIKSCNHEYKSDCFHNDALNMIDKVITTSLNSIKHNINESFFNNVINLQGFLDCIKHANIIKTYTFEFDKTSGDIKLSLYFELERTYSEYDSLF